MSNESSIGPQLLGAVEYSKQRKFSLFKNEIKPMSDDNSADPNNNLK